MRIMSTIKNIIIFVLSVALALETGFVVIGASLLSALNEEKKASMERRKDRLSYRDYYNGRSS